MSLPQVTGYEGPKHLGGRKGEGREREGEREGGRGRERGREGEGGREGGREGKGREIHTISQRKRQYSYHPIQCWHVSRCTPGVGTSLLAVLTTNTIQLISSHFLKRVLKLREGREGGREGGGGGEGGERMSILKYKVH